MLTTYARGVHAEGGPVRVPVRFGHRLLGFVQIRSLGANNQLEVIWTGNGNHAPEHQILNTRQRRNGRRLYLQCPSCDKIRTNLFLVARVSTLFCRVPEPFSFVMRNLREIHR